MRKTVVRWAVVGTAALIIGFTAFYIFYTSDFFMRVAARVTVDGISAEARVYKGTKGKIAVSVGSTRDAGVEVYVPERKDVFACGTSHFYTVGPFGILQDLAEPASCMSSSEREISLDLEVNGRKIAFNRGAGSLKQRIEIQH